MAADLSVKKNSFVARVTQEINALLDVHDRLIALESEYVALDYGNETTGITDAVLQDSNSKHLDRSMFLGGFTTLAAIDGLFAAGHATNLQRFRG